MMIETKAEDDENDPEKSINAYNTLKDWGMQVLDGPTTSKPCIAVGAEAESDNMFLITPSGSAVECVATDNAFRVCFADPDQGTASAKYIGENKLATKIAIIYDSSTEYSSGIREAFVAEAANQGLEIVADEAFTADSNTDFSVQLDKAKEAGADMICLPEMFSCPYETPNFPVYAEPGGGPSWQTLSGLAERYQGYRSAGSVPESDENGNVYNTAYVFDREGRQIAKHRKVHLFDIDVKGGQRFKESDTLTAGDKSTVFETEFGPMGLCICYDFRFPELARRMVLDGAQVILVPAAFNMTTGPAHWEILFRSRAVDNQVFTFGTAPARDMDASYHSWGHSIAVSPWGTVLNQMEAEEGMQITSIDLDEVEQVREQLPLLKHRMADL